MQKPGTVQLLILCVWFFLSGFTISEVIITWCRDMSPNWRGHHRLNRQLNVAIRCSICNKAGVLVIQNLLKSAKLQSYGTNAHKQHIHRKSSFPDQKGDNNPRRDCEVQQKPEVPSHLAFLSLPVKKVLVSILGVWRRISW